MVKLLQRFTCVGLLVGTLMTGGLYPAFAQEAVSRSGRQQVAAPAQEPTLLERIQDEVAKIAKQTRSGIVTIQDARSLSAKVAVRDTNGVVLSSIPKSGSGFSIGEGYILTTADVVTGMANPIATTDAGEQLRLRLVNLDPELNLALLRTVLGGAPPISLPALNLGDSSAVVPGHFAISIGNQAGQLNSVALSMVSGIRTQGFSSYSHFYPALLQIDGVIGAGNSGAPVMNARGEVIGMVAAALSNEAESGVGLPNANMNTMFNGSIYNSMMNDMFNNSVFGPMINSGIVRPGPSRGTQQSPSNSAGGASVSGGTIVGQQGVTASRTSPPGTSKMVTQQIVVNGSSGEGTRSYRAVGSASLTGFAIPVNSFKCLLPALKSGVSIVHAWLGTELEENVVISEETTGIVRLERKVLVRALYAGGPAAKSGALRPRDRLVSINGRPINTANDVRAVVLVQLDPGQKVEVQIVRNQTPMTVTLTVEAHPTVMPPLVDPTPQTQSPSR